MRWMVCPARLGENADRVAALGEGDLLGERARPAVCGRSRRSGCSAACGPPARMPPAGRWSARDAPSGRCGADESSTDLIGNNVIAVLLVREIQSTLAGLKSGRGQVGRCSVAIACNIDARQSPVVLASTLVVHGQLASKMHAFARDSSTAVISGRSRHHDGCIDRVGVRP